MKGGRSSQGMGWGGGGGGGGWGGGERCAIMKSTLCFSSSFACFYRVMMGAMVTNLKGISMDDEVRL